MTGTTSSAHDGPTILLVEDNLDDILLTQRAFRKAGIISKLAVVQDGDEAILYLSRQGAYADRVIPGLVLLDLKLPRKGGLEVLTWVRKQKEMKEVPIVVLTSSRQLEDIARAYAAGANSYIEKPVAFESLQNLVRTLHLYWLEINLTSAIVQR